MGFVAFQWFSTLTAVGWPGKPQPPCNILHAAQLPFFAFGRARCLKHGLPRLSLNLPAAVGHGSARTGSVQ